MSFGLRMTVGAGVVACAALVALTTGCEWTGGGGVEQYNSRYSFVNFSGTYRGSGGGLLITDYTKSAGTTSGNPELDGTSTNSVVGETIATGNGSSTAFAGTLKKRPVLVSSVTITAPPGYVFTDPDGDGNLTASGNAFGTINYETGAWSLDFQGAALDNGSKIVATYKYTVNNSGSGSSGGDTTDGSTASGVTGSAIHSFSVEQFADLLRITDNNGKVYDGKMGEIRSAGGVSTSSTNSALLAGDQFIANFTAEGTSAANKKVKMVGVFSATVQSASTGSFVLDDRVMQGTWIEENGRTGDINGSTAAITIAQP